MPPSIDTGAESVAVCCRAPATSPMRSATPSSSACIMSAGEESSDRPSQAPRAERSQCGQASPASAGTKSMPRSMAAGASKPSIAAKSENRPRPRAQLTAEEAL